MEDFEWPSRASELARWQDTALRRSALEVLWDRNQPSPKVALADTDWAETWEPKIMVAFGDLAEPMGLNLEEYAIREYGADDGLAF